MKIADVFFAAHLDDAGLSVDATKAGTKAGDNLGKTMSGRMKTHLGSIGAGLKDGLKLGAGIAAFGALDSAVSATIGVLGDAADAFKEDQASQEQLAASLKANIPGWQGNTDAIEATLLARERLGFSDDEQRKSLASLLTRTHDVTKALDLQRLAMDLARLRGIDLASASDLVGKAFNGQVGALRKAGIAVDAHATAEEALLAVQKAVSGQAEAYANTDAGREAAAHLKVGEAMEKLGSIVERVAQFALPILADAFTFVVDAATHVGDAVGFVLSPLARLNDVIGALPGPWHTAATEISADALAISASMVEVSKTEQGMADDARESGRIATQATQGLAKNVDMFGQAIVDANDDAGQSFKDMATDAKNASRDMLNVATKTVNDYYDVLIAQDELLATNTEINALRKIAAGRKLTKEEQANLHRLERTQAQLEADLASHGATQSKEFKDTMASLLKRLKTAHGAEKAAIQAEIRQLQLLAVAAAIANGKVLTLEQSIMATLAKGGYISAAGASAGRAQGGPVYAGKVYTVGEHGPETFVPLVSGTIIPNVGVSPQWSGASGMAPVTTNVTNNYANTANVTGLVKAPDPLSIARTLGRFGRTGVLERKVEPA